MNLETISFRKMAITDVDVILDIINFYIAHTTFYFSKTPLEKSNLSGLFNGDNHLPKFVAQVDGEVIGFGYAYPFRPETTFSQTVKVTYWLKEGFTGKGIGRMLYHILENELRISGISDILVNISSENAASLKFHTELGFEKCGDFKNVGYKNGVYFDLVWLQKSLH